MAVVAGDDREDDVDERKDWREPDQDHVKVVVQVDSVPPWCTIVKLLNFGQSDDQCKDSNPVNDAVNDSHEPLFVILPKKILKIQFMKGALLPKGNKDLRFWRMVSCSNYVDNSCY